MENVLHSHFLWIVSGVTEMRAAKIERSTDNGAVEQAINGSARGREGEVKVDGDVVNGQELTRMEMLSTDKSLRGWRCCQRIRACEDGDVVNGQELGKYFYVQESEGLDTLKNVQYWWANPRRGVLIGNKKPLAHV